MDTILLGLDASKGAQAAARCTARIAAGIDARVVAVHVMPRSDLWTLGALQVDAKRVVDNARSLLDTSWTAPIRKAEIDYTTRFVRGDPEVELLRIATRLNVAMLVLGSKGHGPVHDLVIGGTVHKLINRSTRPVVLVPTDRSR